MFAFVVKTVSKQIRLHSSLHNSSKLNYLNNYLIMKLSKTRLTGRVTIDLDQWFSNEAISIKINQDP